MVTAGMAPRQALAQVEERLAAAGCPDADFDARELFRLAAGRDPHLSPMRPAAWNRSPPGGPDGNPCNTSAADGLF